MSEVCKECNGLMSEFPLGSCTTPHITNKPPPREFYVGSDLIIVDEEMIPILAKFTWHINRDKQTKYAVTNVKIAGKQTSLSMHRLLCGLPNSEIDHINRNGLDNRLCNLRFCTKAENQRNRKRENKFGFRGVYKTKKNISTFACQIQINGRKIHEVGFKTAEDAARRYDELCKQYHGEFGIRNFED